MNYKTITSQVIGVSFHPRPCSPYTHGGDSLFIYWQSVPVRSCCMQPLQVGRNARFLGVRRVLLPIRTRLRECLT